MAMELLVQPIRVVAVVLVLTLMVLELAEVLALSF
jgi:hypothetical protein